MTQYETVYEVTWDGTRARNPYLMATPEVPKAASELPPVSVPRQVLDELRHGGMSARRLLAVLEASRTSVYNALERLQTLGLVTVGGSGWNQVRRCTESIYELTEKGRRA